MLKNLLHKLEGDRVIWVVAIILAFFSILAVYGSVGSLAVRDRGGNTEYYLLKHLIMLGGGFFIMYRVSKINFSYFSKAGQILIWVAMGLLLLTLIKGTNLNNANRWLTIPIINQSFQTSDFAKITLVLVIARLLSVNANDIGNLGKVLLPALGFIGGTCGLILPANFSTAALLGTVCFVMLFIAKVPTKQLLAVVGAGIVGFAMLIVTSMAFPDLLPRATTWKNRLLNYNEASANPDANYQVEHAKYAIAMGGFAPNGPGTGTSRNYLPHPYSDMIYAFIIEEYGSVLGGLFIIGLYLILLFRVVRVAISCPKMFGSLTVMGLGFMIVLQAFINMGVAVSLFPVTGQPLPLVSMGGTSTLFNCLSLGIILSISNTKSSGETEVQKSATEHRYESK